MYGETGWWLGMVRGKVEYGDGVGMVCGKENGHTSGHYVLRCSCVRQFRNNGIIDVTLRIICMLQNGELEKILKKSKAFAPQL